MFERGDEESPNNAGAFAAAHEKKGTNTNAAACVAASRRDKTPRDAEASISRGESGDRSSPFTVSPGSDPRCDLNEEGVGKEKAR